jgi:hypothetical protein
MWQILLARICKPRHLITENTVEHAKFRNKRKVFEGSYEWP